MKTDYIMLQQDTVTAKDYPITIVWLKLFMVIKKHMNLHEYGTEVAKNESERE
jgi:hypothetical protein